jgi:Ca2+-binding RTX toxin-like protein
MKRSITRYGLRLLVLGAASAFCLAYTSQARAAEVWLEDREVNGQMEAVIKYVAAPGEANAVTVTRSGSSVLISEAGGPGITPYWGFLAEWGCHNDNMSVTLALCSYRDGRGIVQADLMLGDGDDRATISATLRSTLNGEAGADQLRGGPRADQLVGGDGSDLLTGNGDCDVLFGGGASDWLDGGSGADVLDGGDGRDYADYSQRAGGVRVTLDGPVFGGTSCAALLPTGASFPIGNDDGGSSGTEGDNVHANVENVWGGAGNDVLIGNGANNLLEGGAGNDGLDGAAGDDELLGGLGSDELDGGLGSDIVDGGDDPDPSANFDRTSYAGRPSGVSVTLDGIANDGERSLQEKDNIVRLEQVTGTYYADNLIGDNAANFFYGLEGDDYYLGRGGADSLIDGGFMDPEGGSDVFDARDGGANDTISCGEDFDADEFDEFDFIFYEALVDGSKSDQLSGSCDEFMLTYLPVIVVEA